MSPRKLVSATLVVLATAMTPAVVHAIDATVTVNGVAFAVATPCSTPPAGLDPSNGNACVDLSGIYGSVTILGFNPDGSGAQVAALRGDTVNQLLLQGAAITNNDPVNPVTVTVQYGHGFLGSETSPINTSVPRFYGVSISGNFFRPPFNLASNDQVMMTGSVTYSLFEGSTSSCITGGTPLDCVGEGASPLVYTVPSGGDPSNNNYGPQTPQQVNNQFTCGTSCVQMERLQSTVATTTLAAQDSNILAGSAHTVGATTQSARDSVLAASTAKIDVDFHPDEDSAGVVRVILFGSPTFDVVPCADSSCSNGVDYSKVVFGPGKAPVGKRLHFRDVDGDGILDAVLRFEADDTEIKCDDKVATLTGVGTFGGLVLPFSASDGLPPRRCDSREDGREGAREREPRGAGDMGDG